MLVNETRNIRNVFLVFTVTYTLRTLYSASVIIGQDLMSGTIDALWLFYMLTGFFPLIFDVVPIGYLIYSHYKNYSYQ